MLIAINYLNQGEKMKKILVAVVMVFFVCSMAKAEQINFKWAANTDATEGYIIYELFEDGSTPDLVIDVPGINNTTAGYDVDIPQGTCRFWTIIAYGTIDGKLYKSDYAEYVKKCAEWPVPEVIRINPQQVNGFSEIP